jgi:membrane fusion protein (multidrug efflux system)
VADVPAVLGYLEISLKLRPEIPEKIPGSIMGEQRLKPALNLVGGKESAVEAERPSPPASPTAPIRPFWVTLLGLAVLAAMVGTISMPLKGFVEEILYYEVTDDAQISGRVSMVSAKVSGVVTMVNFEDNVRVKKGQLLVQLDPRDYTNKVAQLKGELSAVTATFWNASKDRDRGKYLLDHEYMPQNTYDALDAKYKEALGKVWSVQAQLEQAKLDLEYTEIRAPADGVVGKRIVEPGMIIRPMQSFTSFVESKDRWIVANFKETQLPRMSLGQEVEIKVDAIGNKTFLGNIESLAPGSGATFALIPPDNATGNFTKIVQRVPVKIQFSAESIRGYEDRLMPGISVTVRIRVREKK